MASSDDFASWWRPQNRQLTTIVHICHVDIGNNKLLILATTSTPHLNDIVRIWKERRIQGSHGLKHRDNVNDWLSDKTSTVEKQRKPHIAFFLETVLFVFLTHWKFHSFLKRNQHLKTFSLISTIRALTVSFARKCATGHWHWSHSPRHESCVSHLACGQWLNIPWGGVMCLLPTFHWRSHMDGTIDGGRVQHDGAVIKGQLRIGRPLLLVDWKVRVVNDYDAIKRGSVFWSMNIRQLQCPKTQESVVLHIVRTCKQVQSPRTAISQKWAVARIFNLCSHDLVDGVLIEKNYVSSFWGRSGCN